MADTAKNWPLARAPRRTILLGDKVKRPEPAQHIIEAPGVAIEMSRTTGGLYWAHIVINHQHAGDDFDGIHQALGEVVGARIDDDRGVHDVPRFDGIHQIAVLVRPVRGGR